MFSKSFATVLGFVGFVAAVFGAPGQASAQACGPWNNWCMPVCGEWNNWCEGECGPWNGWCGAEGYYAPDPAYRYDRPRRYYGDRPGWKSPRYGDREGWHDRDRHKGDKKKKSRKGGKDDGKKKAYKDGKDKKKAYKDGKGDGKKGRKGGRGDGKKKHAKKGKGRRG